MHALIFLLLFSLWLIFQIHSLTARSVPRQFREGLKAGRPLDRNIKVVHAADADDSSKQRLSDPHTRTTPTAKTLKKTNLSSTSSGSQLNIVYDSEQKDLVPYPEGEYIRTPSPEHSGIPARPVQIMRKTSAEEQEYTSDGSSYRASVAAATPPQRKYPPTRRRSKNNAPQPIR